MSIHQNQYVQEGQILPQLRIELEVTEQLFDGLPYWIIKDPLSLRYYRFSREEYFVIDQLREQITVDELKNAYWQTFKSDDLTTEDIRSFVIDLISKNLVLTQQPNRDKMLYEAGRRRWKTKFKGQVTNFMFFRIPFCDPDRLFNTLIPHLRWIWTKTFAWLYLILFCVALGLIIERFNDFGTMFQNQFFTLYNLGYVFATIWLFKGLHELGHGLTCKNYGGEVHEMGYLCLVFMPFLYCNVTDSWTFTKKRHRFLVTAAGILTEMFLACLATIVWYLTDPPSFIHTLSFNVVVACSISTVLFNANPLLKFDGYYMLMDLIEVPNLRQRAGRFVNGMFVRYFLGGHAEELREEHRYRILFPIYSVAASIYRWFVTISILGLLYRYLAQVNLKWLGSVVVLVSLVTMLIYPLVQAGAMIAKKREAYGISNTRLLTLLSGLVIFVGIALFWPMKQHVTLNFILEPTKMAYLRSEVDGEVHWAEGIGENVWFDVDSKKAPLAFRLANPDLGYEKIRLESGIEQASVDLELAKKRRFPAQIKQVEQRLTLLRSDRQRLDQRLASQEVKIPFESRILSNDFFIRDLEGQFHRRGTPLLLVADTREMTAKVWVTEKHYARIFHHTNHLGQDTKLLLYAFPDESFKGQIVSVGQHSEKTMGEFGEKMALSNKIGGEVLTEYDPFTEQERPVEAVYEVTLALEPDSMVSSARAYMTGRVRIDCGRSTLFNWGKDSLLRFISPDIRL